MARIGAPEKPHHPVAVSPPAAATISIADTLSLLDGPFASMAQGVAESQYTFWLGSGISRDRVSNVFDLVKKVLEHFRSRIDPTNPTCPNREALGKILVKAKLPPPYLKTLTSCIDSGTPVSAWPKEETDWTVQRLAERYADMLDVQVTGEADEDHILWTAVDVAKTYGDGSLQPDCEHLCVALLIAEGVASDIATANWDGLIEVADQELRGTNPASIKVCVRKEDLRGPPARARLIKFHGCAVKALQDEATYRPLLVARRTQIEAWPKHPGVAAMRHELVSLAKRTQTLMIGLSAQDSNIRDIFIEAEGLMEWSWPSPEPPALVYAEDKIGSDQDQLLRLVYNSHFAAHAAAIRQSAHLPAFGKPLLTALVLRVLCGKLQALVTTLDTLAPSQRDELADEIRRLRDRVAAAAESVRDAKGAPDRLAFIRLLVTHTAHALALFGAGHPHVAAGEYLPLTDKPVHHIATDPQPQASGKRELAAALALLGRGETKGMGTLDLAPVASPDSGALTINGSVGPTRVFFAMSDEKLVRMQADMRVKDDDDDAVVIQSGTVAPRMPRSPHGTYGRTGIGGLRVVGMAPLLAQATDIDGLLNDFRQGIGL